MNVLIADDHLLFLEGITALLHARFSVINVVHAHDYEQLDKVLLNNSVDLLIMDLRMPGINKDRNYLKLITDNPTLPIVVLSASENQAEVDAVMQAGAMAFIPKAASTDFLIEKIQQVIEGERYYPTLSYSNLGSDSDEKLQEVLQSSINLSKRHLEVLQGVSQGLTNAMIAESLFISEHTVKTHLAKVYKVLQVNTRVECVQKARLVGLI